MGTQAEKIKDEITTDELEQENKTQEETKEGSEDEVEIAVDGEEELPTITEGQLKGRLARSSKKLDAANVKSSAAEERALMLEEENKLLRLQAKQSKPQKRPVDLDFESDAEFEKALSDFNKAEIAEEVKKQTTEAIKASQAQSATAKQASDLDAMIDTHYERSSKLGVTDYEAVESVAIDIMGEDAAKVIVTTSDVSDKILYHLGLKANKAKAEQIRSLIDSQQPGKVMMILGNIEEIVKRKPKTKNAPDPESKLPGGSTVTGIDAKIDKAREDAARTGDMSKLMALKKEKKLAGAKR
ncbi:hypothetical protein MNBD_GAMMA01-1334 [hydrothermal vent metagenome]|uniref:Uncharacterized protein n=1 Tax=hydrothermal vent metagenome TaxID=652676 RepID=A0A3B0W2X6_9ZZZZ